MLHNLHILQFTGPPSSPRAPGLQREHCVSWQERAGAAQSLCLPQEGLIPTSLTNLGSNFGVFFEPAAPGLAGQDTGEGMRVLADSVLCTWRSMKIRRCRGAFLPVWECSCCPGSPGVSFVLSGARQELICRTTLLTQAPSGSRAAPLSAAGTQALHQPLPSMGSKPLWHRPHCFEDSVITLPGLGAGPQESPPDPER